MQRDSRSQKGKSQNTKPGLHGQPAKGADTRADHHTDQREKAEGVLHTALTPLHKGHRDAGIHGKRDHKAFQN